MGPDIGEGLDHKPALRPTGVGQVKYAIRPRHRPRVQNIDVDGAGSVPVVGPHTAEVVLNGVHGARQRVQIGRRIDDQDRVQVFEVGVFRPRAHGFGLVERGDREHAHTR